MLGLTPLLQQQCLLKLLQQLHCKFCTILTVTVSIKLVLLHQLTIVVNLFIQIQMLQKFCKNMCNCSYCSQHSLQDCKWMRFMNISLCLQIVGNYGCRERHIQILQVQTNLIQPLMLNLICQFDKFSFYLQQLFSLVSKLQNLFIKIAFESWLSTCTNHGNTNNNNRTFLIL
ncbi:unnamed protein product [Paramecium sonneborni]|uniref:Uncharacterized protein n=1 Tax=Paramecium sonneborni TaxID=65129 RepID=A0A8S1RJM4_9CILI|nr:unnamed protein product [Paramecium sonneborni]